MHYQDFKGEVVLPSCPGGLVVRKIGLNQESYFLATGSGEKTARFENNLAEKYFVDRGNNVQTD